MIAREPSLEKWCQENKKEELLEQWDRQGNPFTPADIYYHSRTQCRWVCEKGHKWSAAPERRTKHKTTACPYCTGRLLTPSVNSLAALYPAQAAFFDSVRNRTTPEMPFTCTPSLSILMQYSSFSALLSSALKAVNSLLVSGSAE